MLRQVAIAAGVFSALTLIGTWWQWEAFRALDAASRAAWIQAIGSVLAIFASSGVALWIDQGSAARIAADRKNEEQAIRIAVGKVLTDAAEAMDKFSVECAGKTIRVPDLDQKLWGMNTARDVMQGMLSQRIPADLVEVLIRAKVSVDAYVATAKPDSMPNPTTSSITYEGDLMENTKIMTDALRTIVRERVGTINKL